MSLTVFSIYSASIARQGTTITCDPDRGEVMVRSESTGMENQMTKSKSNHGQFNSPNWPARYTPETRCVFRFVAGPGEKVRIQFDYFRLLGEMPTCSDDFLDVYIDVASSSLDNDRQNALLTHLASGEPLTTTPFSAAVYSSVLDRSALLGRYCGSYLNKSPIEFISLHREIVIDFFANFDSKPASTWSPDTRNSVLGFNGSYEFINDGSSAISEWNCSMNGSGGFCSILWLSFLLI
ncbi:CUB domain protein [Paragonimus heterotremus]|uniref:CUB domain protein n=1 Tax=Paragonimus heterotremus TaxID=100268 RepID=A0A8J4WKB4_9TREM|nr:CUB domain protein [Paragonimus heterotremus]